MPPKKTKTKPQSQSQSQAGAADREGAQEEPLCAILIADTFCRAFSPLEVSRTHHRPACPLLLPVLGVPLLQLHLASCHKAGAEQVHIISRAHANTLRRWLQQHPPPKGLHVHVLAAPTAGSVGDVMREVDAHGIVRSDFLLLQPHALTSIHLQSVVEMHRQRRKRDKDASMTICAAQVGHASSIRPPHAAVHTLSSCDRLLHYDPPASPLSSSPTTRIPAEVLLAQEHQDHGEFIIRSDLVEIGIDVCGPEPLRPGNVSWPGERYALRGTAFIGPDVSVARDARLGRNVVIGAQSSIAQGVVLDCTAVGSHVDIASSSTISHSHLWDGVRIGSRCEMDHCIIGTGAQILDDCKLARGCVIGPDVIVGPSISLAPFTRIGARSRANALEVEDLEEDVEDRAPDADLGSQAFGYRWPAAGESTTDEIAEGEEADEDDDDVDAPLRDHIGALEIDLQKGRRHEGEEEEDSDISSIGGDSELLDEWDGDSETLSSLDDAAAASLTLGGEVSPDAIIEWWKSPISRAGGEAALDLRKKAEGIVRYIVEDDEDESEEESE
ncbi:Translation initiation factor 2B, epsilon subunit (eIF-2Bepsilon/GCD6) [Ceraceosorus bombacis]|uniref:Translation initiation factor 2B, epsilon subunit (EIF-2Bepsilon/GCD6) n=1 Tax=Ceraceosorus bombacis TaxID=401625 RepID=A0A0P1BGH1_9BASI|nr:Translation initiation factor 2B, epsilon subunit (eIF-2Bepsilon/GCD6) [Ceraceosorus bombacis]